MNKSESLQFTWNSKIKKITFIKVTFFVILSNFEAEIRRDRKLINLIGFENGKSLVGEITGIQLYRQKIINK